MKMTNSTCDLCTDRKGTCWNLDTEAACNEAAGDDLFTRKEESSERVELHAHTLYTKKESAVHAEELIKAAIKSGHKCVTITDFNTVQGFPAFMEATEAISSESSIKTIYGMEAYTYDDVLGAELGEEYVVFRTEQDDKTHEISEISAVLIKNQIISQVFSKCICSIDLIPEVLSEFLSFAGEKTLVCYNTESGISILKDLTEKHGHKLRNKIINFEELIRKAPLNTRKYTINDCTPVANYYDFFSTGNDSLKKVRLLSSIILKLAEAEKSTADYCHRMIIVKNATGLKNLYKLVTESNLKYSDKGCPAIPKSRLVKFREGLVIGCEYKEGEILRGIRKGLSDEELCKIASFYDYLEIQPASGCLSLLYNNSLNIEVLKTINKKIVEIGDTMNIPVCATGDVHYIDPEDKIVRDILKDCSGVRSDDIFDDLHFRSTQEMLDELSYFGEEKARKLVIDNPASISDLVEQVRPIPAEKCYPYKMGADEKIEKLCVMRAHEIYGERLPEIVENRITEELHAITENGYSTTYMIVNDIVRKIRNKGGEVWFRGSLGASFIAYLLGITGINPLPPHYHCPVCGKTEFTDDYKYDSGYDLPEKKCDLCGIDYVRDGQDIPYETFMGIKGEKRPDIELSVDSYNISIISKTLEKAAVGRVIQAGGVSGVSHRRALLDVDEYLKKNNIELPSDKKEKIISQLEGSITESTFPMYGYYIIPEGSETEDFTPVQKVSDGEKVTQFEFRYLNDVLLKIGLHGNKMIDDFIKLEARTGIPRNNISMFDPSVYNGFVSTAPIGVTPDQIHWPNSAIGIQDAESDLINELLASVNVSNFSELLKITGIKFGSGTWYRNAKNLLESEICGLSEIVGCREDIFLTLTRKYDIDRETAYKIMEHVRKNRRKRPFKPEITELLRKHGVPGWYIESLQSISYLFPKAHLVQIVINEIKMMWYKIHYSKDFYKVILADTFNISNIDMIAGGKEYIKTKIDECFDGKGPSVKGRDIFLINEYLQRGYEFL